jgi:RNA polymerase sigma-70 factor (ECF subfamily)
VSREEPTAGPSDEDLACQAQAGSIAAFDELARRLQGPLLGFLQRRFPSRRDAEDLVQETLIKAYRSLGQYRAGRRFRPWAFAIGYHLAVSWGRGEGKLAELPERVADDGAGPAQVVEREDHGKRVWEIARNVLSNDHVEALWLHYVEGLSVVELARVMGRSRVATKVMLHRARARLEPHLTQLGDKIMAVHTGATR